MDNLVSKDILNQPIVCINKISSIKSSINCDHNQINLPSLTPLKIIENLTTDADTSTFEIGYGNYHKHYKIVDKTADSSVKTCKIFSAKNRGLKITEIEKTKVTGHFIPVQPSRSTNQSSRPNKKRKYDLSDTDDNTD